MCYQKIKVYNARNGTIQHLRTHSLAAYFFCFREEAPENFARSVSKQSSKIKKGIAFIHDLLHLKRFEVDHKRILKKSFRFCYASCHGDETDQRLKKKKNTEAKLEWVRY